MSDFQLHCPVCNDDFEVQIKPAGYRGGTVDFSGESRSDVNVQSDCPECGFHVYADFVYNPKFSDEVMLTENQHSFEKRYVEVATVREVWTSVDASPLPNEICRECESNTQQGGTGKCSICLGYENHIIIRWEVQDLMSIRPHLTIEQAAEVLSVVKRKHDAEIGINWDVLSIHADMMYPMEEEE